MGYDDDGYMMPVEIDGVIKTVDQHTERLKSKLSFLNLIHANRSPLLSTTISTVQKEIQNAIDKRENIIKEFERGLDRDINTLKAKLSFLIESYNPERYSWQMYQTNITTVQKEIEYSIRLKGEIDRLKQTRFVSDSELLLTTSQKFTILNGHVIRYLDYGFHNSTETLILLHGLGASAERWALVIPELARYYRVIVPDIIGFGYSDKPAIEYRMDFFLDFLKSFLGNLGISKATIIGSSFGGHIATEFAIEFKEKVERLVLVSPAGMMRTPTPTLNRYIRAALFPVYEHVYEVFREMVYDPEIIKEDLVIDFINRMELTNAKHAFHSTLCNIGHNAPNLHGRISKIVAPTTLVWGEHDRMIPLQYAREYDEIPERELVVIGNCGHTPYVETPAEFNDAFERRTRW
jgi:2-hydroxy-6-oxonona-2,4-dienedioate hydrolase